MNGADTKSVHYTLGVLQATIFGIRHTLPLVTVGTELNSYQRMVLDDIYTAISRAEAQVALYDEGLKDRRKEYSKITE